MFSPQVAPAAYGVKSLLKRIFHLENSPESNAVVENWELLDVFFLNGDLRVEIRPY